MEMPCVRRGLCIGTAALILGAAGTPAAASSITVPTCDALTAWSASVAANDTYTVAPALPLPKALADENLVPIFGLPALDWTAEDLKAAADAITACYYEARTAKDKGSMDSLVAGKGAIASSLAKTLAFSAKIRADVAARRDAIAAQPDSPELDRALAALIEADPAAPDLSQTAGLPRDVVTPVWAIAKSLPYILDDDREQLFAALAERRTAIQAGISASLDHEIAASPATADGVIALVQIRQRIAAMAISDALVQLDGEAAARAEAIRATLREGTPPGWVPPDCLDLYGWSGSAEAQQSVTLGQQATQRAFLDEHVVPVFGTSIGAWTDEEMTRFQTLRAACQATWRGMPGSNAIASLPEDAPALLKLAARGYWIDTADQQITQARAVIQAHGAALAALAAVEMQIAALPDSPESLARLHQLSSDPSQYGVDEARRQSFQAAAATKQRAINARALSAAMDGLAQVQVDTLPDLVNLVTYTNTAFMTIVDPNDQQRFFGAAEQAMHQATDSLLPAFKGKLDEMPATLSGFHEARSAVNDLTGVTDSENAPSFRSFHDAIAERAAAIIATMHEENCATLLDLLDIDDDAAEQLVWDGDKGTKLGVFVCDLTESGSPVHEYNDGGMFSSEQTLKATLAMGGLQTLSLHEAEVAQGTEMLVGFKMADANQERPIAVQEWAIFTAMATGGRIVTPELCKPVMSTPEDQLTLDERMMGVACAEEILNGTWGFQ